MKKIALNPHLTLVIALWSAIGLVVLPAHAKPLTKAEQRICKTLDQCLSIVARHPHDSFDYDLLAKEFQRFGSSGEKALLRMITRDRDGAAHAADLLALSAEPSLIPALEEAITDRPARESALLRRLHAALSIRFSEKSTVQGVSPSSALQLNKGPVPCRFGDAVEVSDKKRQMPFFELNVGGPDKYGMIRPSAEYPLPLHNISRNRLNSALSIGTDWLAAYDGGLIYYDGATGRPTVLSKLQAVAVQPWIDSDGKQAIKAADKRSVWAVLTDGQNTIIMDATPPAPLIEARLPGTPAHFRRIANNDLTLSTSENLTVRLRPDGSITNGCAPVADSPTSQ